KRHRHPSLTSAAHVPLQHPTPNIATLSLPPLCHLRIKRTGCRLELACYAVHRLFRPLVLNISTAAVSETRRTLATAPPAIDVRDLEYAYGDRKALDGLSLEVPAGSI